MKTEKEIRGTPEVLEKSFETAVDISKLEEILETSEEILFLGCGSSFHLSTVMSHYVVRKFKKRSRSILGSEMILSMDSNVLGNVNYAVFSISRSGETTETIIATKNFKKLGKPIVSITCEESSTLSKLGDLSITSPSKEESVVMTQSFSSILLILIKSFKEMLGEDISVLRDLVDESKRILEDSFGFFGSFNLESFNHFIFLGSGENLGLSNEASLKLKEMALVHSESHSTLDYRHGPKALIGERSFVMIQFYPDEKNHVLDLRKELQGYGAKVMTVGPGGDINLPKFPRGDDSFVRTIPFQVLGLEVAKLKGLNLDKPEKLDKVVRLTKGVSGC